jgi:hypothetical protein
MTQDIEDFFAPTSDDLTKLPETPPGLREILLNLSLPDTLSSPDIPSRRSPRNHGNMVIIKKVYVLPKRKRKPQDPNQLKKENLTFKKVWTIGRHWLEHQVIDNKNLMFCTICQRASLNNSKWTKGGCDTMKLEFVKRHENSAGHKNSLQILDPSQTGIKEGVNQMLGRGMDSVVTQMRNIYFLSSQNIAINVYPDLANLVNYQKENPTNIVSDVPLQILRPPILPCQKDNSTSQISKSNYATYANKVSGHELLVSVVRPIEEAVVNEIRSSSCWSLLVDESNTVSAGEKTLALVSKHMVDNIVTDVFWESQQYLMFPQNHYLKQLIRLFYKKGCLQINYFILEVMERQI